MFETVRPDPEPPPEVAAWGATGDRPAFVRPAPDPGNGLATTSLVLGIVGLLILFPTLGLGFIFSLPFSIAGWVTGTLGRRQVDRGLTKVGDGTAHAGRILGVVGVVLGVIGAVVWLVVLASVDFDIDELRRELERDR